MTCGSGRKPMQGFLCTLLIAAAVAVTQTGECQSAQAIRLAVQKTGTFSWELAVIRAHGLDKEAGLTLEVRELANAEAGKVALRAGDTDIIISDFLWVSRERTLGASLTFYPYSSALGGVMVPNASTIKTAADLRGRKLAVAGGPIDKNWLILQAALKRQNIDLRQEATIVYGAPPLLAAAMLNGEADATVTYWNFGALLEGKGFRRVTSVQDLARSFGAKGPVAMLGYVFDEGWGHANHAGLARFIEMTRKAKEILATSDSEWHTISSLTGGPDETALKVYRDRYREGIPRRTVSEEEADARILYRVLADIGGHDIVGPADELAPGTFFHQLGGE